MLTKAAAVILVLVISCTVPVVETPTPRPDRHAVPDPYPRAQTGQPTCDEADTDLRAGIVQGSRREGSVLRGCPDGHRESPTGLRSRNVPGSPGRLPGGSAAPRQDESCPAEQNRHNLPGAAAAPGGDPPLHGRPGRGGQCHGRGKPGYHLCSGHAVHSGHGRRQGGPWPWSRPPETGSTPTRRPTPSLAGCYAQQGNHLQALQHADAALEIALGPDASPMGLHDPLADGQAQAGPAGLPSPLLAVEPRELPEQVR